MQLHRSGQLQQAESLYRKILDRTPRDVTVLYLLGMVHYQRKQYHEAVANFERVAHLKPKHAEALAHLGGAYNALGRHDEAMDCMERALALAPHLHEWRMPLASLLCRASRFPEAITQLTAMLKSAPDHAGAHHFLAKIYLTLHQNEPAVQHFQRTLALGNATPAVCNSLGNALSNLGRYTEALDAYQRAVQLAPANDDNYFGAWIGIGNAKLSQGYYADAADAYQKAIDHDNPEISLRAHTNLLLALHYLPQTGAAIFDCAKKWNDRYAAPLMPVAPSCADLASSSTRLRIGYVSSDFRNHAVGYFLQNVLPDHSDAVEFFLYSSHSGTDNLTEWFKALPGCHWRDIASLTDEDAAAMIRADGIHILVDLSGHTGGHRLLVFARKPAPVQVTWLGYCDTTGLDAMDYLLADAITIPPDTHQQFTEKIWRLPGSYLCYRGPDYTPDVVPPPAMRAGHVTFGCLNNLSKINTETIKLWADILRRIPTAQLVCKTKQLRDRDAHDRYLRHFLDNGVPADRLTLSGEFLQHAEHFAYYGNIDIALDTFPYNGVTTTCEAAWMGVPTVTLAGESFISRNGASILTHLGLPELVASTPEQYVDIAVNLASDLPRLNTLRSTMRARFAASPLGDPQLFTKNLEQAYREMWQQWCATRAGNQTDWTSPRAG
ncbi:MAG: tetratricopeptide repeat protein [Pseudomonadota bacterium]